MVEPIYRMRAGYDLIQGKLGGFISLIIDLYMHSHAEHGNEK